MGILYQSVWRANIDAAKRMANCVRIVYVLCLMRGRARAAFQLVEKTPAK